MPNQPIVEAIEDKIKVLVGAIRSGGGEYYNNWSEERVAFGASSFSGNFPRLLVEVVEERNVDQPDAENVLGPTGAFAGAYHNVITYKMSIGGSNSTRGGLFRALEDLKKVFGINYTLGTSGASAIMYKGFEFEDNDGALIINSYWTVRYYQSRTEPHLSAE